MDTLIIAAAAVFTSLSLILQPVGSSNNRDNDRQFRGRQ